MSVSEIIRSLQYWGGTINHTHNKGAKVGSQEKLPRGCKKLSLDREIPYNQTGRKDRGFFRRNKLGIFR